VIFETDDNYLIPFEISNNSSTIRFETKKNIRTALVNSIAHHTHSSADRTHLMNFSLKTFPEMMTVITQRLGSTVCQ